jgi:hypothetical protein
MASRKFGWCIFLCLSAPAMGQITVPGADGSDGAFNPAVNTTVRLDLAPTGTWNGANTQPGFGVYDADKWAVVYRYSSVNIPSGVTVTFQNHPSGAPVVWLISGPVTINGTVSVSASIASFLGFQLPGPGGFRGAGTNSTGGLGPGGGIAGSVNGSYGAGPRQYGNSRVLPLIGGSGQAYDGANGYGGGGAILIAGSGTVTINGSVLARGLTFLSSQGSSGGGVRIICDRLGGSGQVFADAPPIAVLVGRIRFEVNQLAFAHPGNPVASFGLPGSVAQIWPEDAMTDPPSVRVVSLGSNSVPGDPRASFEFPYADVNTAVTGAQTLTIECRNIPTGLDPPMVQAWNVVARTVPRSGTVQDISASYVSGNFALSTWEAQVTLPTGFSAIQVRASMPPQ